MSHRGVTTQLSRYANRFLAFLKPTVRPIDPVDVPFTAVMPSLTHDFGSEMTFDGQRIGFTGPVAKTHPAMGVFTLADCEVRAADGLIVCGGNRWVWPTSWFSENPEDIRHTTRAFRTASWSTRRVKGRVLTLATEFARRNYGHFLLDSLGRLAILEAAHVDPTSFDAIIVNGPETAWKRRLLARFGLPLANIVWTDYADLVCEQLTATSFPGVRRSYAPWLVDFFRSIQPPPTDDAPGPRLFLSRTGTSRCVWNEDALLNVAKKHGFVRYVPTEAADPIRDIGGAAAVISAHGAALSDIGFMRPGSTVVELIPSDHRYGYYFTLARSARLNYTAILGKSVTERPTGAWGPSTSDFSVDPEALRRCLEELFPADSR